jgi:hypothetical protein
MSATFSKRFGVVESMAKTARELWKDKGKGTIKSAEWSESDGLLMFRGVVVTNLLGSAR